MAVFNRNLELGGKEPREAVTELQNYIRYMQEQIEFYAALQRRQYEALERSVTERSAERLGAGR